MISMHTALTSKRNSQIGGTEFYLGMKKDFYDNLKVKTQDISGQPW